MRPIKKILLVCSDNCEELANQFKSRSFSFVIVTDGEKAVERVERERFDATVILSTGKNMDAFETALNLRDINREMRIFVPRQAVAINPEQESLFPSIYWCNRAEIVSLLNLEEPG